MSEHVITNLTTAELVSIYNRLSKIEVKKFKDRKTAEARLHGLAITIPEKFLKAMKAEKVKPALIAQYEIDVKQEQERAEKAAAKAEIDNKKAAEEPTAQPKAPKPGPKVQVVAKAQESPATEQQSAWSSAVKPLLDAQAEEKKKLEAEAGPMEDVRKKRPSRTPTTLLMESRAAAVLWHIQIGIKGQISKGEDAVLTSTDIARRAMTSTKEVIKQIDLLRDLKLVEIEDDTTPGEESFYYVTITKEGEAFNIMAPVGGYPAKEKKEPKEPKERKAKLPGAAPGPRSDNAGKKIYRLVKENPRREGSIGHHSFSLIRDGMPYEEYIELGGRAGDIKWDVEHSFVELK